MNGDFTKATLDSPSVLKDLSWQVVSFSLSTNARVVEVREQNDGLYYAYLNKQQFGQLIAELEALQQNMTE